MSKEDSLSLTKINIDPNNLINEQFYKLQKRLEDNINNKISLNWS